MPQSPDWNKYLDAGAEFVAMTRAQARRRAKELVGQGQLAQEQVQGFVDDLVEESRRRTDLALEVLRKEIQRQVKTLGIATKEDLARLEARIAKQGSTAARSAAKKAAKNGSRKATAKPAAKKSPKKGPKKQATKKQATKKPASAKGKKTATSAAKNRATAKSAS
jgi:polyhydroxyalkanoate synthesis regulator phasin